jgi:hypothetical protein
MITVPARQEFLRISTGSARTVYLRSLVSSSFSMSDFEGFRGGVGVRARGFNFLYRIIGDLVLRSRGGVALL